MYDAVIAQNFVNPAANWNSPVLSLALHKDLVLPGLNPSNVYELSYLVPVKAVELGGEKYTGYQSSAEEFFDNEEDALAAFDARLASGAPEFPTLLISG